MKRFILPLTTAVSAAMLASPGCSSASREWQTSANNGVCVDGSGKRIPEDQCHNQPATGISPIAGITLIRAATSRLITTRSEEAFYEPTAPADS